MEMLDYVKNILFFKKPFRPQNMEEIKEYKPFLVNRWVSMLNGECANIVNQTTNKKGFLQDDKEMQYKLLLKVVPENKISRINYIKKVDNQT